MNKSSNQIRYMQHPVPKCILTAIGDITVSFAMLESQLHSFAGWLLTTNDRTSNIITSFLSFKDLITFIEGLYLERLGKNDRYEELIGLLGRAKKINELRNQITHSVWGAGQTKKSVTRIKHTCREKKGLQYKFENIHNDEFEKIAFDIKYLASNIQDYSIQMIDLSFKP